MRSFRLGALEDGFGVVSFDGFMFSCRLTPRTHWASRATAMKVAAIRKKTLATMFVVEDDRPDIDEKGGPRTMSCDWHSSITSTQLGLIAQELQRSGAGHRRLLSRLHLSEAQIRRLTQPGTGPSLRAFSAGTGCIVQPHDGRPRCTAPTAASRTSSCAAPPPPSPTGRRAARCSSPAWIWCAATTRR